MAALKLTRFRIDPADTEEMLARRGTLVAAVKDAFPGLFETQLAKLDEERWVDVGIDDGALRA